MCQVSLLKGAVFASGSSFAGESEFERQNRILTQKSCNFGIHWNNPFPKGVSVYQNYLEV